MFKSLMGKIIGIKSSISTILEKLYQFSFDFCPYCGTRMGDNSEDWGMLGKNDFILYDFILLFPLKFLILSKSSKTCFFG